MTGSNGESGYFVISVAARILNMHPQTLRYYERAGLIRPSRSKGNIRLYSTGDLQQAQYIKRLIVDLGVNLAGVDVIIQLTERLRQLDEENQRLRAAADASSTAEA